MWKYLLLTYVILAAACTRVPQSLVVEAEQFDKLGGWIADAQFHELVGSAYIQAHGIGKPVEDAVTTIKLPSKGRYNIWVRTYNWNAPWDSTLAPGTFQLLIDGKTVADKLGDKPTKWDWQEAGSVDYNGKPLKLTLHDLTGFDGRCDAIYFTQEDKPVFPADRTGKVKVDRNTYDLVVVGAGPGGLGAAVASSRLGRKTLLIESRDVVGGNSAPGIEVGGSGYVKTGPYKELGNVMCEYGNGFRYYDKFMSHLKSEENLTLLTGVRVIEAETGNGAIKSVTALETRTGKRIRFKGKFYVDCTGDANLGLLAGAEYLQGAETGDVYGEDLAPEEPVSRSYGSSIRWRAKTGEVRTEFPLTPWAVQFNEKTCIRKMQNFWYFEAGFNKDQITEAERIRDYLLRVVYGNWSYMKNSPENSEAYADAYLEFVGTALGKRESRRLLGDYVLTQNDIEGEWKKQEDAAVWCSYCIDQHFPLPSNSEDFPGEEFLATMKTNHHPLGVGRRKLKQGIDYNDPYMMPYRCLYSKNVSNLFMAGRNVSMSRIALCSARIEGGISIMGEVTAIAAALCDKLGCTPRELYTDHLNELKESLKKGIPSKFETMYKMD